MYQDNLFAIDLAKTSYQGCLFNKNQQPQFNRSFSRDKLIEYLTRQKPMTVAMEACGTAHHMARVVAGMGHTPLLLPARSVARYREGHKTDVTDALAVGTAARQPVVKPVAPKTLEQQGMQGVERVRMHFSDYLTATSNMIRGLLAEFGYTIPKGISAFKRQVVEILEVIEDDLPMPLRIQLMSAWDSYQSIEAAHQEAAKARDQLVAQHEGCQGLTRLAGIGPVNALGLYLTLGNNGASFRNGREASACIGLTPTQHSTGGKTVMLGIRKKAGANKRLRSSLIQGAKATVYALMKRKPKNKSERHLKALIERRGPGKAAVALANKNVRLAWAMLHYGDDFKLQL